jgi:CRISPR-associated endonuclease/helicase Cas3
MTPSGAVEAERPRAARPEGLHPAIAHRAEDGREHLLQEHLEAVGALAREFASKWGAESYGEIAGLLHDLRKYAADFQAYIRAASRSPDERRDAHIELEPGSNGQLTRSPLSSGSGVD